MTKKRSTMKLQQKAQQKQYYLVAASVSLFLIIGAFFFSAYLLEWDVGLSNPPQQSNSQQLSSRQSGNWGNGNVWNRGKQQQTASNLFKDNKQELAFNLDTVSFPGGTINGNRLNAQSLKKCQGNGGNGKGNKGGNSGKGGNTSQAICQAIGNGSGLDKAHDVIKTNDGNYVAIGQSHAFNNNGQLYVVKFDVNPGNKGNNKITKLWETQVGNANQLDEGNAIVQNSNGDFIAVGSAKTNNLGKQVYIVKLDNQGKLEWQRTVGPSSKDVANDILYTNSGNYLLTGTTKKWGYNSKGIYVLNFKLRSNGKGIEKRWDKVLGALGKANKGIAAGQLSGGDFAITGYTGYDQNANQSNGEIYVTRLSNNGHVKWGRTIGNSNTDDPHDMTVDNNDDIVVTGHGKVSVNGNDKVSVIVTKLDPNGNLQWSTGFHKKGKTSYGRAITTLSGNQYLIGGYSSTPNSNKDAYVAKLGTSGNLVWDKFGGAGSNEKIYGILPRSNGDYLAVGRSNSTKGGNGDLLVANVGSKGTVCGNCSGKSRKTRSKQRLKNFKAVDNGDFLFEVKTVSTQTQSRSVNSTKQSNSNCAPFCTGYGGGGDEWFNDVIETRNGYIYVGRSSSFGSGSKNIYAVKVNDSFQVQWAYTIGNSNGKQAGYAIAPTGTSDEYLISGISKTNSFGNRDFYLVRIKDKGSDLTVQKAWQIGGPDSDDGNDLVRLNNGNYVLAGESKSFVNNSDGVLLNFSLSHGNQLNINWTRFTGSPATNDGIEAVAASANNALTTVGYTDEQNNTGIYTSQYNADGRFQWGNVIGGPNTDKPFGIARNKQGETVIAGQSKAAGGTGSQDAYIAKLDATGTKKWDKVLGESNGVDRARDVIFNKAGNIVFTGGFKDQNTREVYLSILSTFGTELYANEFGGQSLDRGRTLLQSDDNYYVIGGQSQSSTYSRNNNAALAYRINPNGIPSASNSSGGGSGSSNSIPGNNDVAVVTKQTISVKNQDRTIGRLQLQNKGKVQVQSGRKLTVEDDLNLGQGSLEVKKGGELVIPDTASIRNIKGTNLTGKVSFENAQGTVDSSVFRKQNKQTIQKAAVHGFSSGNDFEASYKPKDPKKQLSGSMEPGLFGVSSAEYFEINRQSGSGKARVTLFWDQNSKTNFSNVQDTADLVVAHYNASKGEWENYGRSEVSGKLNGSGYITSKMQNSFSPNSFGSESSNSPLPVELTSFEVEPTNNRVHLSWETASETNNKQFKVQRRTGEQAFETIGEVEGAGTTYEPQSYQFYDGNPSEGTNYYRLKQVDFDGSHEFSAIKAVNFEGSDRSIDLALKQVSPNPFQREIQVVYTLPSAKAAQLRLRNVSGEVVDEWTQSGNRGKNAYTARPPQGLSKGTYILSLITDQNRVTRKLIKR